MLFPTIEFAVFFVVVLCLSWALMPRPALWKPFMIAASYAFYAAANWRFVALLAGLSLWNQLFATLIDRTGRDTVRAKRLLAAAVAGDLAVLAVFKYYGFFVEEVSGTLSSVGLGLPLPVLAVALPVGISFITFQAISYVVDVKRGDCERATTTDVLLFISFFPQLVAGPILRASEFLPQLRSPRDPRQVAVGAAFLLIVVGLVKKVVVADTLAREVVDPVFAVPEAYSGADVLLALYAYAVQIFCDFSGYTDIAIGVALLLGYVLPKNFDRPYRCTSFREFFQRWHLSLSRFLRDYLFIPLGGSRGGSILTARNLMITMLLGGLWHGAAWGFVLWGAIFGAGMVLERTFEGMVRLGLPFWFRWAVFFHVLVLSFVPFRAADLGLTLDVWRQLGADGAATLWTPVPVLLVVAIVASHLVPERWLDAVRLRLEGLRPTVLAASLAVVVVLVAATVPSQGTPPFIYFAF